MAKLRLEYTQLDLSIDGGIQKTLIEMTGDGEKEHIETAVTALMAAMGFVEIKVRIGAN